MATGADGSSATALSRTRKSKLTAMVIVKDKPQNWQRDTILARLMEKSGANTVLVATGEALKQVNEFECGRIYEIEVPPTTVRTSWWGPKHGVPAKFDVQLQHPFQARLSKEQWDAQYPFTFIAWDAIDGSQPGAYIDLIGRAVSAPVLSLMAGLQKALLHLENGSFEQTVTLLGGHAALSIAKGDVVAFAGISVAEYRQEKTLQTSRLTYIVRNPAEREGVPRVPFAEPQEPKRKALRMTATAVVPVSGIEQRASTVAEQNETQSDTFQVVGSFPKLTSEFFTNDAPVIEGQAGDLKLRWNTKLTDNTGTVGVTVWDRACQQIFGRSAKCVHEAWVAGVESEDEQEAVLEDMNANLDRQYRCACSARFWKDVLQVSVNMIESA